MVDFQRFAETLTIQMAELLQADVVVTDERERIVAGSDARTIGMPLRAAGGSFREASLRVPLRVEARAGEVIVAVPRRDGELTPRLAQAIVELVINRTLDTESAPDRRARQNAFIYDLLRGATTDEATILRQAKVVGVDLAPPRAVILIDAADFILDPDGAEDDQRLRFVIGSIVSFFTLPSDTICAYLGGARWRC